MPGLRSVPDEPKLQVQLLGGMSLQWAGEALPTPRVSKGWWLLAVLALRDGGDVDREWLAGTLWPESDDPLGTMRRTLTDLRRTLGEAEGLLHSRTRESIRLETQHCIVDAIEFQRASASERLEDLCRAVELYNGDLLPSCDLPWISEQRAALQHRFLVAVERLAGHYSRAGQVDEAIPLLRRGIAIDDLRESLYRALMDALSQRGRIAEALLAYRDLRRRLRREVKAEPSPESLELYRKLRAKVSSSTRDEREPAPKQHAYLFNVPARLTKLLGRDEELNSIAGLLDQARLVTLLGFGGIGKTHLATEAAHQLRGRFEDGVAFVELANVGDSSEVAAAVAATLEIRDMAASNTLESLVSALSRREMLLILDNAEHVIKGSAALAGALLGACPHLQILVTSRQPLGITGEAAHPVPPLRVPKSDPETKLSIDDILILFPAVKLFAERAAAVEPSFRLTADNVRTVADLCACLEGIPLAIELAAARVKSLSVDQIRARMRDRFGLLSTGSSTAAPRQQTLRGLIEWSHDLLSEPEHAVFRRLSVFSGGWSLEAVEEVCEQGRSSPGVLDVVGLLVEKSLVQSDAAPDGTRRYRMLETVREYAAEKLDETDDREPTELAHRSFFLRALERAYLNRKGAGERQYLNLVETEGDNLRVAIARCLGAPLGAEAGLLLAGYMQDYWWIRGYLREGEALLNSVLKHPDAQRSSKARALALSGLGILSWMQGKNERAAALMRDSLSVSRELNLDRETAVGLSNLGSVYRDLGELVRARSCQEESLAVFRRLDAPWNVASTLTNLGSVTRLQGDLETARKCFEEAVQIRRRIEDERGVATSLCGLGEVWVELNDTQRALQCFEEALKLQREFRDKTNLTITLIDLARVLRKEGDVNHAFDLAREALEVCVETGDSMSEVAILDLAALMVDKERFDDAALLLGVRLTDGSESALTREEVRQREALIGHLRTLVGEQRFGVLCTEGSRSDPREVVSRLT